MNNTREYLFQNKIATFNQAEIYDYYDTMGTKHCYVVKNFDPKHASNELLDFILPKINPDQPVASLAGDSILRTTTNDLIIFHNTNAQSIRESILKDATQHPYSVSFKTAEFHSYLTLVDHITNQQYTFGVSPRTVGALFGPGYVRDDTAYDQKYFRGDTLIVPGTKSPYLDYASISISFDLTAEQVLHLESFVKFCAYNWFHPEAQPFHLFAYNCSNFAAQVFNVICSDMDAAPDHYYAYHIIDELDFNDKGIFYNYVTAYPEALYTQPNLIYHTIFANILSPLNNLFTPVSQLYDTSPPQILTSIITDPAGAHYGAPCPYPHAPQEFIDEARWLNLEEIEAISSLYAIQHPHEVLQSYDFLL